MSFASEIKSHLTFTAITAVVSDRIFPVVMPQDKTVPAIVYQQVAIDQVSHLAGRSATLRHIRLQIDCYALTYSELLTLEAAVRSRMDTATSTMRSDLLQSGIDDFEPDTKRYRRVLEFSCWFNET